MPTIETLLRQELRNYAVELRQLAYTLPNGVGEHNLLQMSDRMRAAADQVARKGAWRCRAANEARPALLYRRCVGEPRKGFASPGFRRPA
jgi:hypothetical protein